MHDRYCTVTNKSTGSGGWCNGGCHHGACSLTEESLSPLFTLSILNIAARRRSCRHLYRLKLPTSAAGFSGSSFFLVPRRPVTWSQAQPSASSIPTISMKPPPTSSATNTMI